MCRCKSDSPSHSLCRYRICESGYGCDCVHLCVYIRIKRPVSFTNDSPSLFHVNGLPFCAVSRPFRLVLNFLDLFCRERRRKMVGASVTMPHVCERARVYDINFIEIHLSTAAPHSPINRNISVKSSNKCCHNILTLR